jgi:DNA-binding PadR family transcriptional regulator
MSLRYAMLSALLDGEATGYELAKRFDSSISNFWHALPQQLYQELGRMEDDGLVAGEAVVQTGRPNKRIFSITDDGRGALAAWLEEPYRLHGMKEEFLIKMYSSDLAAPDDVIRFLEAYIAPHEEKLRVYESMRDLMFHGRDEAQFIRTTHRIGPYLALKRGLIYERENIDWARWTIEAMRERIASGAHPPHGAIGIRR